MAAHGKPLFRPKNAGKGRLGGRPGSCPKGLTVDGDLGVLLELVEPESLVELLLGGDAARVAFVVDPLHGELVGRGTSGPEAADRPHLLAQLVHADARGDIRDLDLPAKCARLRRILRSVSRFIANFLHGKREVAAFTARPLKCYGA
jgi:hypothetical protein